MRNNLLIPVIIFSFNNLKSQHWLQPGAMLVILFTNHFIYLYILNPTPFYKYVL
jgi:hypothetical protein